MKTLIAALAALLSVASHATEQKFSSLPIGANLDGYVHSIKILVAGNGLSYSVWQSYPYNRSTDGPLEAFAARKLREYSSSLQPADATSLYGWEIQAVTEGIGGLSPYYGGDAAIAVAPLPDEREEARFRFIPRDGNKWEIPPEVLEKVRFDFGWGVGYYIPEVTGLEVNLYYPKGKVLRFSTLDRIFPEDHPCQAGAILDSLKSGWVMIPVEIARAQPALWEYADIILHTPHSSETYRVNRTAEDGKAIRWSNPPPSFFVPPSPRIASLKRVADVTEITVENANTPVFEFSTDLREWVEVSGIEIVLKGASPSVFRHRHSGSLGFYRLRQQNVGAQ